LSAKDNLGRCGVLLDEGSLCVIGCGGWNQFTICF
jgi:hypothetical protein